MGVKAPSPGTHRAMGYRPHKLRVVYEAEGRDAETLSFDHRGARDAACRHYEESPFVISVESWDEPSSIQRLIRQAVES